MFKTIEQSYKDQLDAALESVERAKQDVQFCKLQLKQIQKYRKLVKSPVLAQIRAYFALHRQDEEPTPGGYCLTVHDVQGEVTCPLLERTPNYSSHFDVYRVPSVPGLVVYVNQKYPTL